MTSPANHREVVIDIVCEADVIGARKVGREMACGLGLGLADQTRLATAISELVRNVLIYAGKGWCTITAETADAWRSIAVRVEDHGPGIADVAKAMTHGFSTGGGLGAGLPGAKRLVDEFHVQSRPGMTVVTAAIRRRKA